MAPPGPRAVDDATPNANGLYHACGNVWEWTADGFGRLHSPRDARNPSGNLGAHDKVVKGGSYLCAPSYCARFRPSSRRPETQNATTGHLGFRVAKG
ncbi:MAG: formylglycine-generating enzyme family protein [Sedimentitalea sp.]